MMDKLKCLFVGVGSIARRHIKNLGVICEYSGISLTIEAYRHQQSKGDRLQGVDRNYYDIADVPEDYDVVFITNPTELHLDSLKNFHEKGHHFFVEKPVVSIRNIDDARCFPKREGSVYYVACPLRYCAVIEYLKEHLSPEDVISVRAISSSYLPDWRPGQDYRQTYSAHKDMGGGVAIDLIHEWDYLTYLFGMPNRLSCFNGRISDLEIDSDDYAIYIAESDNMITELHLDYFGRKTIREIQIFTHDETIIGDIQNGRITYLNDGRIVELSEERDDYQRKELEHFLAIIDGDIDQDNDLCRALDVLMLSQGKVR